MRDGCEASGALVAPAIEEDRVRRVGEAAYEALVEMGESPLHARQEAADYMAEQRCEAPPQVEEERMLGLEMVKRMENPELDRFLGRPENADDMEDSHGRSLLIGLPD